MELKELLISSIETKTTTLDNELQIVEDYLYGQELTRIKEELLKCEEFSECEELIILNHPIVEDMNGVAKVVPTFKIGEGMKFKGKCYLLSLSLTPVMYNPTDYVKPIKDGAVITPTIYDPITFEPKKKIILEFSPDRVQDGVTNHEEIVRQELHDLLDKVLNHPNEYQHEGSRYVMVRGLFEVVSSPDGEQVSELGELKVDSDKHQLVFFFDETNENEVTLEKMIIPRELSEKYIEEIGFGPVKTTKEKIEEFIKKNSN